MYYYLSIIIKPCCLGILCSLLFLATACDKEIKTQQQTSSTEVEQKSVKFQLQSSVKINGFTTHDIHILASTLVDNVDGIHISFRTTIAKSLLDSLKKLGYNGCYINMTCGSASGNTIESQQSIELGSKIHTNKAQFFAFPSERLVQYHFPYRLLGLNPGSHKLQFSYALHPVKFKTDSSSTNIFTLQHIEQKAWASEQIEFTIQSPPLSKISIQIAEFKLDPKGKDLHNYDFSMGGSGLPDLYWDVYCGDELIYYAPQKKNSSSYTEPHRSKTFLCAQNDIIRIHFTDYDNGPFNTQDDIIETWEGTIKDLPLGKVDTLRFKKVEYAIFSAKEQ